MPKKISATEAARSFSDILNRVRYRGEEFVIERGGEAVCRMIPATAPTRATGRQMAAVVRDLPRPDAEFVAHVAEAVRRQGRVPRSRWGR